MRDQPEGQDVREEQDGEPGSPGCIEQAKHRVLVSLHDFEERSSENATKCRYILPAFTIGVGLGALTIWQLLKNNDFGFEDGDLKGLVTEDNKNYWNGTFSSITGIIVASSSFFAAYASENFVVGLFHDRAEPDGEHVAQEIQVNPDELDLELAGGHIEVEEPADHVVEFLSPEIVMQMVLAAFEENPNAFVVGNDAQLQELLPENAHPNIGIRWPAEADQFGRRIPELYNLNENAQGFLPDEAHQAALEPGAGEDELVIVAGAAAPAPNPVNTYDAEQDEAKEAALSPRSKVNNAKKEQAKDTKHSKDSIRK